MITPEYCRTMARYNAWQNEGLRRALTALPRAELERDRGAFFGSIMATANHLLWADMVWMSRLDGGSRPEGGIAGSVRLAKNVADWEAQRFRADGRIRVWADDVNAVDLVGRLTWMSGSAGREVSRPLALCVMHLFNHQTHHRGQIHAMLTQAGTELPDTDLFLMPDAG
jgi:uncharacterized damage-inducible protein DinB